MKDFCDGNSVNSSPVPQINVTPKDIQKEIIKKQIKQIQSEVHKEIGELIETHPNARRYSHRLLTLCLRIFFVSSVAYGVMSLFLPLPSVRTLYKRQKDLLQDFQIPLTDINKTNLLIKQNTNNWEENTPVILGFDAVSINPLITVFDNRTVTGILSKYEMQKQFLSQACETINLFEKWISDNKNQIVDSLFVFQVQPLNPSLNSFIVHILPSKGGKGSPETLETLISVTKELEKCKIKVISYASDGDNYISKFHHQNIIGHYSDLNFHLISDFSNPLIISDPLHLLKRVRYHFIPYLHDTNFIQLILNLPSMVFRNDRASKMHDKLPLLLFQLKNYEKLVANKLFNYSFYILPHTLLLASISQNMTYDERLLCLSMSRILIEHMYFPQNPIPMHMPFKNQVTTDTLSTIVTFLEILNIKNVEEIHLNRLGTNPLEHAFGTIRMRSRDHHRCTRFINEAGKLNAIRRINEELLLDNIKHRELQFGQVVTVPKVINTNTTLASDYIEALFKEARTGSCDETCSYVHSFFKKIISENSNQINTCKCYLFKSTQVVLEPNSNINIEKRQQASSMIQHKCRWSTDEIALLKHLARDFNGNITKIIQYFPKRTAKSIIEKLNKLYGTKNK